MSEGAGDLSVKVRIIGDQGVISDRAKNVAG